MRRILWICACALALTGCPDDDGGAGGGTDDTDGTAGNVDSGRADTGAVDRGATDSTAPPADMGVEPDQGTPADMAVPPADMAVPPPDMALPPDMGPECQVGEERACPGDCAGGTQGCVDGAWAPCVFPAEICNGTDDDCDGSTDEDFAGLGEACEAGVGACAAAGEVVCNGEGDAVVCNAVAGAAAPEACDGIDNDCDGSADEDVSEPCYDGPDGTEGVGSCSGGRRVCADGAFGACNGAVLPGDELCNANDDDCDGTIDESFGGGALVESCYEGPAGSQDVGICRGGQRLCQAGAFGPCNEQILPGQEICDLVDNDCNGQVDDRMGGCECIPGDEQACYSGAAGTAGVGICQEGRQICNENGRFGACEGEIVPQVELCDGADNDCNGRVDDAVAGAGQDCAVGVGACREGGRTVCDAASGDVICDAEPGRPVAERCNQTDDDCDGRTDEGLGLGDDCSVGVGACAARGVQICAPDGTVTCSARPGVGRPELCNDIDDDCDGRTDEDLGLGDGCAVGVGACRRDGRRICDPNGQIVCSAQPGQPGAEACNAVDDDCDNRVDEGNPGGGQDCNTGNPGICAAGTRVCAGGAFECRQAAQPAAEACDGLDNDCDGRVDDGIAPRPCYSGPAGTQNVGPCRGGQSSCNNGMFGACAGEIVPRPELCDSVDNDCNGRVDDVAAGACVCQAGSTQACYTGPEGTQDVGICRAGRQTCLPGGMGFGPCENQVVPGAEVCDGQDNDCNRRVDDVAGAGVACSAGEGQCRRDGQLACDARTGQLACNAQPGQPSPEICDGLDNDCNRQVDDVAGLGERCTSGVGVCLRAGNQICDLNRRELVCSAMAGMGGAEICDGEDDDCDGRTDEQSPGVGERCVVGVGACQAAGATVCNGADGIACSAQPGQPQPEVCDGIDNDCNAAIDDNPRDVGQACTVGVGACRRGGRTTCSRGELGCDGQAGQPGFEVCNDEDDDCDGRTDEGLVCEIFRSCAHARQSGQAQSGVYRVQAGPQVAPQSVYCDMTTDGGGWTLVGSTLNQTLNDQASPWYEDLVRLDPAAAHTGVWDGLRPLGDRWDVRFSCRAAVGAANAPMDVDLSFYDVPWYTEMTTGTDAQSCFSENTGYYADSRVPARRDNIGNRFRRREDPYGAGYLEGEDNCTDTSDFTVDFDDRGMDSDQSDGTDWGEDDGTRKCGASGLAGGQWFVWARERPRVAVVGLPDSTTNLLRDNGLLADTYAFDANLARNLTVEKYDTVLIGRYATRWPSLTQDIKEALDVFGREGGNLVTEWDGAAIFMSVYDPSFRYSAGASLPLGWFGGRIGGGNSRGNNTAISPVAPVDPVFAGTPNPIRAGGASEFFFWLKDVGGVEFPVLLNAPTIATFPGGVASFPDPTYGAVYRGRYCDSNALFTTFDWSDDPTNAGLGPFVANLVRQASLPPPADLPEECNERRRSVVLQCGASARPLTEFDISGRLVQGCTPDASTQVMFVTRAGIAGLQAVPRATLTAYLNAGGIIIGEYSVSDELYNLVFAGAVVQAANRSGSCNDNIMPQVQAGASDSFWQDNRFVGTPAAASGCGFDISAFPNIVKLGGWDANTTQIGYRDQGEGRVWFVEADWQDQQPMSQASKGLMRYMATHRGRGAFGRGANFAGVRINQNIHDYIQAGFAPCFQGLYSGSADLPAILDACQGSTLMMACRQVGSQTLTVAAMGARAEVLTDVGVDNGAVHAHNGVNWYYSGVRSWGFAPAGQAVNRNSCDTNNTLPEQRLCWHTGADRVTTGWRCGAATGLNGNANWERIVLQRFGDAPVDPPVIIR